MHGDWAIPNENTKDNQAHRGTRVSRSTGTRITKKDKTRRSEASSKALKRLEPTGKAREPKAEEQWKFARADLEQHRRVEPSSRKNRTTQRQKHAQTLFDRGRARGAGQAANPQRSGRDTRTEPRQTGQTLLTSYPNPTWKRPSDINSVANPLERSGAVSSHRRRGRPRDHGRHQVL